MNPAQYILVSAVQLYRWTLSPAKTFLFGSLGGCRFTPSCSAYALDAIRTYGALVGTALAFKRVCRCHPWGACGHDPVPEKRAGVLSLKSEVRSPESVAQTRWSATNAR